MHPLTCKYEYLRFWIGTSPADTVKADAIATFRDGYAHAEPLVIQPQCFVHIEGLYGPPPPTRPELDAYTVAKAIRQFIECSGLVGPGKPLQRLEVDSIYFPKPAPVEPWTDLLANVDFPVSLLGPARKDEPRVPAFKLGSSFKFP